jgi:hypothetical protein
MRISLSTGAGAACAVLALVLSLSAEAAFAHGSASFGAPAMRAGGVHGHASGPGWRNNSRSSWAWRGQNHFRWGRNGRFGNQFGLLGGYWPYGFSDSGDGAGGGGALVVIGAPVLNVDPAAASASLGGPEGGCVIHKLLYDRTGKYVGERQTPEC